MKERAKLAINEQGILEETGQKQISVEDYQELTSINYVPLNNWLVLQPLPGKETTTSSGILLPATKNEFKAAIVAAGENSTFKRGQVVRIDPNMFTPYVEYIDNKPVMECPEHLIKGIYTNVDLSTWSSDNK